MIAFLPAMTAGLLTGLSLIIAIGAQNAFVIRQGLTKQHVFLVVAICAAADAVLIFLGVGGLGAIIQGLPWLLEVIRWFGVVYLTWFGIKSLRSVFKEQALDASGVQSGSAGKAVAAVLGFTFLNPHVYLDTVILLGSIGNQFGEGKWLFALGASLASVLWFSAIGFGAKAASGLMKKPVFWKVLDSIIAAVMFSIAILLAFYKF
jgi:L-lysine exporter family protein LysE/ArgO